MFDDYFWFLECTGREKSITLDWISDENERGKAFKKASSFVDLTVELTKQVADRNGYLRYLIV